MAKSGLTKIQLFEELAQLDENGVSRWVSVDEFVGKYQFNRIIYVKNKFR